MCFKTPKDNSADIARREEEERKQRIAEGRTRIDKIFSQFGPDYYSGAEQSYLDYYKPQLDDQYDNAKKKTIAGLYKSGNIQGSAGAETLADLFKDYNRHARAIADQAIGQREKLRADVARSRSDLIAQLEGGAGIESVAQSANARAAALTQPQPYSPIADLFAQWTNTYATNKEMQARGYPGMTMPGFGGSSSSSMSVVG